MSSQKPEHDVAAARQRLAEAALTRELDQATSIPGPASRNGASLPATATGDVTRLDDTPLLIHATNAVCERLGLHLTRWVGADGWRALLRRAATECKSSYSDLAPVLDELSRLRPGPAGVTRESCESMLVALTDVLGRFVGPAMASRLIEQGLALGGDQPPGGSDRG